MSVEEHFERRRTLQRQRTSDHRARKRTKQREERLSTRCANLPSAMLNVYAAEAVEEREERLSKRHGIQQLRERD